MHKTVAFEITYGRIYRRDLLVVWHQSPRTGECGWSFSVLSTEELSKVKKLAKEELTYLFSEPEEDVYEAKLPAIESLITIAELILWRVWRKRLQPKYLPVLLSLSGNPIDNLRIFFERKMEYSDVERLFWIIARTLKTQDRKWWQHPKWHVHHWRLQFMPLFHLKRFLFSRCAKCGKRFPWVYAPISCMGDTGPRWFKGEKGIYHHECCGELRAVNKGYIVQENP